MKRIEEYIIDESPEISFGEVEGWVQKFFVAFPALRHRNYQLYFGGQLISLIGTWMHFVAQGWLAFELTKSAFYVGLISALSMLPVLLFALVGGVIVDRFPKKKILLYTQSAAMIFSFGLAVFTLTGYINIVLLGFLVFLMGIVDAIDRPARQSFAIEMVGREHLASAIALNSAIFNAARVLGPAIAGIIIVIVGSGGAFLVNSVSYIAVLIALHLIRVQEKVSVSHPHPIQAIQEGISYAFNHQTIRLLLFFAAVSSIFGWTYSTLIPVIVHDVFGMDASGLMYLYVPGGIGALLGSLLTSIYYHKYDSFSAMFMGSFLFGIMIVAFSLTSLLPLAMIFLFFAGLGIIIQFSIINTAIQHVVEDRIRGRVMSLYTLMFLGMTPIGSFLVGLLAHILGAQEAIRIGAMIVLTVGLILYIKKKNLHKTFSS